MAAKPKALPWASIRRRFQRRKTWALLHHLFIAFLRWLADIYEMGPNAFWAYARMNARRARTLRSARVCAPWFPEQNNTRKFRRQSHRARKPRKSSSAQVFPQMLKTS